MNGFQIWHFLTDLGLVTSLFYLAFRLFKSPNASDASLRDLESSAKTLMQEAEVAGRSLNQELVERQGNLKRLLLDFENIEARLNRAMSQAESSRQALESRVAESMRYQQSAPVQYSAEPSSPRYASTANATVEQQEFIPPSFRRNLPKGRQQMAEPMEESEPTWGRVNIYGDPIEPRPASTPTNSPEAMRTGNGLNKKIEVERDTPPARRPQRSYDQAYSKKVESVYLAAEEMLLAGEELAKVSKQTGLPIVDIKMLHDMILSRTAPEAEKPVYTESRRDVQDGRLGVLGGATKNNDYI